MENGQAIISGSGMVEAYKGIANYVLESMKEYSSSPVILAGVLRAGEPVAERVAYHLQRNGATVMRGNKEANPGEIVMAPLDIWLYRDDVRSNSNHRRNPNTIVQEPLKMDISGHYVILVDSVFYTGRTARAAMQALRDLGRPERIGLAVLLNRDGHELPIEAGYFFMQTQQISPDQRVALKIGDSEDGSLDELVVEQINPFPLLSSALQ